MSASIFEGQAVKVQKDRVTFPSGISIITGTLDPTVTAVDALKGSLYLNKTSAKIFRKADDGLSQVWIDVSVATLAPLNKVLSNSSGNHQISSATFVDVTNLSATITTTGRPVDIRFVPDGAASAQILLDKSYPWGLSIGLDYKILRGATAVATGRIFYREADTPSPGAFDEHVLQIPVGALNHVDDTAPAGTHTYKLQIAVIGSGGTAGIQNAKLRLREE